MQEVYKALLPENPGLSRTTVYNTLELFAKHGLILSLDFGEGYLRYDGEIKPHTHFKCEKCGAVSDIFTIPENCEKMLPKGSSLSAGSLYLYGKCAACNK